MKTIKANTILLALTTLSVVSISCTYIKHIASSDRGVTSYKASGLSNEQLEGSSIESAPGVIKNWLGDSVSDLANENVTWSFQRSGQDDIVIDVEVTDSEATKGNTGTQDNNDRPDYVYRPLHMHIDDSIREHRLGNYFVNMIHRSAEIWEKNIGKRLFRIRNYSGHTLEGDLAKHDGISNIYYEYLEKEEYRVRLGHVTNKRIDTDIKSLIFNFKKNKRIIEADIVMNGNKLEANPLCLQAIRLTDVNYLYFLSKEDKCTVAYFMAVMAHELGHVLLLGHITNIHSAMMSPQRASELLHRIKSFFDKELLHQCDIDAFNEFYNVEED